jgi:hypothetical protein
MSRIPLYFRLKRPSPLVDPALETRELVLSTAKKYSGATVGRIYFIRKDWRNDPKLRWRAYCDFGGSPYSSGDCRTIKEARDWLEERVLEIFQNGDIY